MRQGKKQAFGGARAAFSAALLAALLLAPGEARAVNDCGALNAGNSFTETCANMAYTGIVYWDQANAVTLTVTGGAATTITAGANNGLHNGITIRTNDDATSPRTSPVRNIGLTVGSGGAVAIRQSGTRASSWYNNRGIVVFQRDGDGATTTLDVRSGVTIGTATAKMESRGIEVTTYESDAGDISVTTAAAIRSEDDGVHVDNRGSGATMVINSGAVTSDARGIYVSDSGAAGAVVVENSGAITSADATNDEGIFAKTTGKDGAGANAGVSITHSAGAISVATGGAGVRAHVGEARQETNAAHADYVAPRNAGLARVSVTGGSIRSELSAIQAINFEAGGVEVSVSRGVALTSTRGHGIEAALTDAGNASGKLAVTNAGTIKAPFHGITSVVEAGSGAMTVTNSGVIEVGGSGIFAVARAGATGAISVANRGAIGRAGARAARGIFVSHDGAGAAGGVTVSNSASITATEYGILAQTKLHDADGANAGTSVTHSAGVISVATDAAVRSNRQGIVARVGNWRQESSPAHADYVAPANRGVARVAVTGGSISSKGTAIEAANYEAGGVEVSVSSGAALASASEHGIYAAIYDPGNADGSVRITQAAAISAAKTGIAVRHDGAGGDVSVTNTGAIGLTSNSPWPAISVSKTGSGSVTVANSGAIGEASGRRRHGYGVFVGHEGAGGGVEIRNTGAISAQIYGVRAQARGSGSVTIANSGAIGRADSRADRGLSASHQGANFAAGGVSVANSGDLWATRYGVFAMTSAGDATGANSGVSVTHSGGDIDVSHASDIEDCAGSIAPVRHCQKGIAAQVGRWRQEDAPAHADYRAPVNRGLARVSVTGGSVRSKGIAVEAANHEAGSVEVSVARGARLSSTFAEGVYAWLSDAGQKSGTVSVVNAGTIDARLSGVYAHPKASRGDVEIVNSGSISSETEFGIYAHYRAEEAGNGRMEVSVAEGGSVSGAKSGVHLRNAGLGDVRSSSDWGRRLLLTETAKNMRRQFVAVEGTVRGGSVAAVHLAGGGALFVGRRGRVLAGASGVAVWTGDDPGGAATRTAGGAANGAAADSVGTPIALQESGSGGARVVIHGLVRGGAAGAAAVHLRDGGAVTIGLNGRVEANGAEMAIRGDAPTSVVIHAAGVDAASVGQAMARVEGAVGGDGAEEEVTFAEASANGATTGFTTTRRLDGAGGSAASSFRCGLATDGRCRLYEALPSVLLALNRLPTYAERTSAPRGASGFWARGEASRGEWKADKAASAEELSYDYSISGGRAGVDLGGRISRFGLSAHVLKAKAKMSGTGEIVVNGAGAGASATWAWGGFHLDFSGHATWFEAEIASTISGALEKDASGAGAAAGVEVGRRMSFAGGAITVTPRLGLVWSSADLDDFADSVGSAARVSLREARSARARAGFTLEAWGRGARAFLSADIERELSDETTVKVADARIRTKVEPTTARVVVGGTVALGESAALTVSGHYEASGSDTNQYGGDASLGVKF